jgi:hypothetical protein
LGITRLHVVVDAVAEPGPYPTTERGKAHSMADQLVRTVDVGLPAAPVPPEDDSAHDC